MGKFHINPATGKVGVCSAKIQCRFGDDPHYTSFNEASEAALKNDPEWEQLSQSYMKSVQRRGDFSHLKESLDIVSQKRENPDDSTAEKIVNKAASTVFGGINKIFSAVFAKPLRTHAELKNRVDQKLASIQEESNEKDRTGRIGEIEREAMRKEKVKRFVGEAYGGSTGSLLGIATTGVPADVLGLNDNSSANRVSPFEK